MKILLLNPPFLPKYSRQSRSPCITKGGTFYYPYYLSYLAGALEKSGFEVVLSDAVANEWSHEKTLEFIKEMHPDLVVMETSTPSIYNDVKFGEKIKKSIPKTHITLVGTHVSRVPEETFRLSKSIDSIVVGEYELALIELARSIEEGNHLKGIGGLFFREGRKIVKNAERKLMTSEQLDTLPFVSYVYKNHFGEAGIRKYFYASLCHPQVTILTARGCPFSCSFCPIPFKGSYRARNVDNVIAEMEYIKKELPFVKEVMIEDDTFPANKQRTLEFCSKMKERKVGLKWSCNARVDADFETLKAMKEAGCRLMCVGFETPEQNVLDDIHKGTTRKKQIEFMKMCRKLGLLVNGCFILGLPKDNKETIMSTIEFSKELNADTSQFYPLMAYPGTEAYEWARKRGFLETEDYSKWITEKGLHTTTVSRPGISSENLVSLCDRARREYYIRPKYIFCKIRQVIRYPPELYRTMKSFRTFFMHMMRGT
jgi:anaerobic magnesium-protoporphyrin IX monomethyl ester cyclase